MLRLVLLLATFALAVTVPAAAQDRPGEPSKQESAAVGMATPGTLRVTWKPEPLALLTTTIAFPLLSPRAFAQGPSAGAPRMSRRRAVLIGAMVGGAGGAVVGTVYCRSDCGGGRPLHSCK